MVVFFTVTLFPVLQNEEVDKKYAGLLEKKWTSVIRLQKKVRNTSFSHGVFLHLCDMKQKDQLNSVVVQQFSPYIVCRRLFSPSFLFG